MRQACDLGQVLYTRAGMRSESADRTSLSEAMENLTTPTAMSDGKKETSAKVES